MGVPTQEGKRLCWHVLEQMCVASCYTNCVTKAHTSTC